MQLIWRFLTGCDWQESRTELRHYYTSHRQRIWLLFTGVVSLVILILVFNKLLGTYPVFQNPTIPSKMNDRFHEVFGAEILLFPALIAVILLLPAVSRYPIDVSRMALLPRKLWSIALSIPFALLFALEHDYRPPYYFPEYWIAVVISMISFLPGVILPAVVLSSFLRGIKAQKAFIIAACSWVVCQIALSVVSWSAYPPAYQDAAFVFLALLNTKYYMYCVFSVSIALLIWHRTRWVTFIIGCFLAMILYLFSPAVFWLISAGLGSKWAYILISTASFLAAGATGNPWIKFEWGFVVY